MLSDAALPPDSTPPTRPREVGGGSVLSASWSSERLSALVDRLTEGSTDLAGADPDDLIDAWCDTVASFLPDGGSNWPVLSEALAKTTELSPQGLAAGLKIVLQGADRKTARQLFRDADAFDHATPPSQPPPILIVLSSNLPALALQPLLAALALRRSVIVKSPSTEPLFTPAFVRALGERSPAVASAWAALTWSGGHSALEAPLFESLDPILVYGQDETIRSIRQRAAGRVVGFGPKLSIGYVAAGADLQPAARGLARDIALFDQRGCLSVQAIYTEQDANALAQALADELSSLSRELPVGPMADELAAAVQSERLRADLKGHDRPELPIECGTVIVDPELDLRPSPGLRTVRIHPTRPEEFLGVLDRGVHEIQGVSVAGPLPPVVHTALQAREIGRIAPAGELQKVDATWHNGGCHPLEILAGEAGSRPDVE